MLTVDYDRLGLEPGEHLLDLGAGFGRHAFEALRRGAHVVACDLGAGELSECTALFAAMIQNGEVPDGATGSAVQADATRLPFPDGHFDRIIASEVLEHIPDDRAALTELARVLRPGGTIAVTVPAWLPETICWKLSDEYHAPFVPGGHLRIYTEDEVRERLAATGTRPTESHRIHALHSPYWWLKCAVGPTKDNHPLVRAYHRLLVWDITRQPLATRLAGRVLDPILGKSLVVYAKAAS
ncbi:MAG: class I SAM-dependent methyltransferase [Actinomycetia bacterium]|nr:class I SAM-dependent methyltransferase [Actinomycetes bacterium]